MEDILRINVTCVVELDTMRTNVEINKITTNNTVQYGYLTKYCNCTVTITNLIVGIQS